MSKNGMTRYIIKRVLYMFLVLFIFFGATFVLIAFGIAVWLDRRSVRRG